MVGEHVVSADSEWGGNSLGAALANTLQGQVDGLDGVWGGAKGLNRLRVRKRSWPTLVPMPPSSLQRAQPVKRDTRLAKQGLFSRAVAAGDLVGTL